MKFGYVMAYVQDVAQTAAFWKAAFGIQTRFVVPTGDYAELETGHTAIAFAAHALGQSNLPQGYAPADASALPQGQELALVTDDVEAALAQAVQAGARLVSPAKVKPWGQTVGYVCTPDGNLIELCSPMPSETDERSDEETLLGHPAVGASWEGFVLENLITAAGPNASAHFYRTSAGAEIDLLLHWPHGESWAIEVKRSLSPKVERGFHIACDDLQPSRQLVVYPGSDSFALGPATQVVPLGELCRQLAQRQG